MRRILTPFTSAFRLKAGPELILIDSIMAPECPLVLLIFLLGRLVSPSRQSLASNQKTAINCASSKMKSNRSSVQLIKKAAGPLRIIIQKISSNRWLNQKLNRKTDQIGTKTFDLYPRGKQSDPWISRRTCRYWTCSRVSSQRWGTATTRGMYRLGLSLS